MYEPIFEKSLFEEVNNNLTFAIRKLMVEWPSG